VSESYEGRQIVGMDLHRRRSVLVRMTETGQRLESSATCHPGAAAGRHCTAGDDPRSQGGPGNIAASGHHSAGSWRRRRLLDCARPRRWSGQAS
jgi:hypothetical protein